MRNPDIVVIGGGNGTSALLSGLSSYDVSLTGVVNTFDNGGSSGRLREEYPGLIGIGDIRQCMSALAKNRQAARRFNMRRSDRHAIGNIALIQAALKAGGIEKIETAIEKWSDDLELTGTVIPVSLANSHLKLSFPEEEGSANIVGEYEIAHCRYDIKNRKGTLSLVPNAGLNPRAASAIEKADYIIIAPGNFYGSIIPPLLTAGIRDSIDKSSGGLIMVANIDNSANTFNFRTEDYVNELYRHTNLSPQTILVHSSEMQANSLWPEKLQITTASGRMNLITANLLSNENGEFDPKDEIAVRRSRLRHSGRLIGELILNQY